jgi:anti-anti-sigma regulatory factor
MRFSLAERGSVFSTRDRGIGLLAILDTQLSQCSADEELVLDFDGVHHVSYSFADEFVATVMQRAVREGSQPPRLEGMSATVERVIDSTLGNYEIPALALAG